MRPNRICNLTRASRGRIPLSVVAALVLVGALLPFEHSIGSADPLVEQAATKTTPTKIFGGKVQLTLPKTANKPKKLTSSLYSIQPRSTSQRFVIFVTKEPLRKDELKKSNKELGRAIKQLLEAQGYEVTSLTTQGTTYTAQFRAYTNAPWQLVGTTATRGTAKFVRTADNELIGSMLLCDPNQWTDPGIAVFKKTVSGAKVSSK
jgi:hypothetical protein